LDESQIWYDVSERSKRGQIRHVFYAPVSGAEMVPTCAGQNLSEELQGDFEELFSGFEVQQC
jgi:hypothetical protein